MYYSSPTIASPEAEPSAIYIYLRKFFEAFGFVFLRTFFTINPGVFVYIIVGLVGAVVSGWAAGGIVIAGLLVVHA